MTSDDPTIPEIADEWADYIIDGLDRSVAAREDGTVNADRVVDVQFAEFMRDPMATIGGIYDQLGLELTDESQSRIRTFLDTHGQSDGGVHRYTWADTGLDAGQWREKAQRYQDYFHVPTEQLP